MRTKAGLESAGAGTPEAGEAAGDLCAGDTQHQQRAKEPARRLDAAAAGAAGVPHTGCGQHWRGSEDPTERLAVAAGAVGRVHTSGSQHRDAGLEATQGGAKKNSGWGKSVGPSPRDMLA